MKRILIFAAYFYPHVGGYEISIYELSKRLAERGFEVDVLTCNTDRAPSAERRDGISIYRLPSWGLLGGVYAVPKPTITAFRILRRLLKEKHDLVQTHSRFFVTSSIGLVVSKLKRKPLVHIEQGSGHAVASSRVVDIVGRVYDHTLGALLVKQADRLICNSGAAAIFLRHLGAGEVTVFPITNGIDFSVFREVSTDLRQRMGLDDAPVISTVSRLIYAKGVQDLISAFPRIRREVPYVKMLVVGDGPFKAELERLAGEVDKENILFLGQRTQPEVAEVLNITDVFVSPSYSEGLPYTIIEAGAVGVPSVAADVGGTGEVIKDRETGLLVSPGDVDALAEKVCQLIRDRDLRERMGRNMQQLVRERFDWDNIIQLYCETVAGV